MTEQKAEEERLFGVSLEQVAAVHAAERAGVSVEERLADLDLDRAVFVRAEQAWSQRLAASLREDPALFVEYDRALLRALASDAPKIVPLEEDLSAWLSFEAHFLRAADPTAFSQTIGLSLDEVARLHGLWATKLDADPDLARQATTLRAEGPGPLPTIQRERRRVLVSRPKDTTRGSAAEPPPTPAISFVAPSPPARWDAGTMEVDLATLGVAAVPFQGGGSGEQAIARAKEHAKETQSAKSTVGETMGATAEIDLRALFRPATGFAGSSATPPPTSQPKAAPVSAPPSEGPIASMGSTGDVPADLLARIARGPTPFQVAPSTPAQASRGATGASEPGKSASGGTLPVAPRTTRPPDGMTMDVPTDLVTKIARGSTPFPNGPMSGGGATPPAPSLTLEQHASLSAELTVFRDRTEAVFAKYHLSDLRQRATIESAWRDRLQKNPTEEREWQRLREHYVAYWTAAKRRGGP